MKKNKGEQRRMKNEDEPRLMKKNKEEVLNDLRVTLQAYQLNMTFCLINIIPNNTYLRPTYTID